MSEKEVKAGNTTSEFQQAQSSKGWAVVSTVLGMVIASGSAIMEMIGMDNTVGILVGAVIAVFGIIQRTLVDLGYIKSRTDVKVAAALGKTE